MWEWLEWIKHGFLKGCSRERERGKKLCLVTETCCVAIVGDNVLIEPQTVWFFRPEVSFKQAREKEMYLSGAPLAASPWLHCSNVNGGLGAVCRDPLNSYPATAPSFSFPLRQLVSFRGSWPSDWCVIAPSLTCPLTALFIGQAASAAFYWALCFQGSGWRAFSLAFSLTLFLTFSFSSLSAINTLWLFTATVPLLHTDSLLLTHSICSTSNCSFICIKVQLLMCNTLTTDTWTYC